MVLEASFIQLLFLGVFIASTVALGQKIFELYIEDQKKK
tara:strand:+ start:155 stop:271 length:117 start_codon:yes stop_codon:yes gene_type:complete